MSDETTTPHKLPAWALLAGATALAIGTRALIALAERSEGFGHYKELTTTSLAAAAFAALVGTYVGRRWINRLSGLLLGVVFAGIAALLLAGSSNIIPGLSVGLLVSGVAILVGNSRRFAVAIGMAIVAAAGIAFAAPVESPQIWGGLVGAFVFLIYGYRLPRREARGLKTWLAFGGHTAAIGSVVAIAAWWGSLAPVRSMIAAIRAPGFLIRFHSLPRPLTALQKHFEMLGVAQVQSVAMSISASDNSFLAALAKLPALEFLEVADATLDAQAFKDLASAPALTTLYLSRCQAAEEAWSALSQTRSLQQIELRETEIGTEGIAALAKIPTLSTLSLEDSGANAEALSAFATHSGLAGLRCSGPTVSAEFLQLLDRLPSITSLSLVNPSHGSPTTNPTPAMSPLREIGELPELTAVRGARNLKSLSLYVPLNDELRRGLIRETPNLLQLDLSRTGPLLPDPEYLDVQGELNNLWHTSGETEISELLQRRTEARCVDLSRCVVLTDDLATIATLSKLETLILDRASVPYEALRELVTAPVLSSVSLRMVRMPDWSIALKGAKFPRWPALRELDLAYNGIVDAELASLGALPNLQSLNLKGNPLTDAALAHLAGMAALERLDLRETQVTAAGVKSLQQRLPKLEILGGE